MWNHRRCCGCNEKSDCCEAGLATPTSWRGLFASSGQVCVYDPGTPVTLSISASGNLAYLNTFGSCAPYSNSFSISGSVELDSLDTDPVHGSVFNQGCSLELSQHFIEFNTSPTNTLVDFAVNVTNDDACGPADVENSFARSVRVNLKPFWNVPTVTTWLDFEIPGIIRWALSGASANVGASPRICMGVTNGGGTVVTATRSVGVTGDCGLSVTVGLNHTLSSGSITQSASCSTTLDWSGLFRCNPEELASLHRAQFMEGRRPEQLARVLGGGRMA